MYGLGFLPIAPEHYDFLLADSRRERPAVQAFLAALRDARRTRDASRALGMRPTAMPMMRLLPLRLAVLISLLSGCSDGAVARPWRTGARARGLGRWTDGALGQF